MVSTPMNEEQWLSCMDLAAMLAVLPWRGYERKLRLLACALHRQYAALFTPQEQAVVEVAERYAEGLSTAADLAVYRPLGTGLAAGTAHTAVRAASSAVFNRMC